MNNVDITKIALSNDEMRMLEHVAENEPISDENFGADATLQRLHDRGLIEFTSSDKYPSPHMDGIYGVIPNALCLSDAGRQFLNHRKAEEAKTKRVFRHNWKIAIFSALTGALLSKPLWSALEYIAALICGGA